MVVTLANGADTHARRCVGAHGNGFKYDLTTHVPIAVRPGHSFGVGQVAGNHVEALRLGTDALPATLKMEVMDMAWLRATTVLIAVQ